MANEAIVLVSRRCMVSGSDVIERPEHTVHMRSDFTHMQ